MTHTNGTNPLDIYGPPRPTRPAITFHAAHLRRHDTTASGKLYDLALDLAEANAADERTASERAAILRHWLAHFASFAVRGLALVLGALPVLVGAIIV